MRRACFVFIGNHLFIGEDNRSEKIVMIGEELDGIDVDGIGNLVDLSAIIFILFWDFLMFYQVLLSPQVKRCAIITYKHGIYELPHELPNNFRLRILGN